MLRTLGAESMAVPQAFQHLLASTVHFLVELQLLWAPNIISASCMHALNGLIDLTVTLLI